MKTVGIQMMLERINLIDILFQHSGKKILEQIKIIF